MWRNSESICQFEMYLTINCKDVLFTAAAFCCFETHDIGRKSKDVTRSMGTPSGRTKKNADYGAIGFNNNLDWGVSTCVAVHKQPRL